MEEGDFFKVSQNKFWMLEVRKNHKGRLDEIAKELYPDDENPTDKLKKANLDKVDEDKAKEIREIQERIKNEGETTLEEVYVFSSEDDATTRFSELVRSEMAEREIDSGDIEEISDKLAGKYNLQQIEIEQEKYNIKAMSWFKLFLSSLAQK